MLVQRQDDTLGAISGTLHTLASQAGLIGGEVAEQSEYVIVYCGVVVEGLADMAPGCWTT